MSEILREREELLRILKSRIQHSQEVMAMQTNKHRKDVSFVVGDKVLL